MTLGGFEYVDRFEDVVDKMLRENPNLESWRDELLTFAGASSARDDDLEEYLGQKAYLPFLSVARIASAQTIPNQVDTILTLDTIEAQSTDLFVWDGADIVQVQENGIVQVHGLCTIGSQATGVTWCQASIEHVGIATHRGPNITAPANVVVIADRFIATVTASAGDQFRLRFYHDSGGSKDVTGVLSLMFLGESA